VPYKFDLDSLHIYGSKDFYGAFLNEHQVSRFRFFDVESSLILFDFLQLYTRPIVVKHSGGHNFPRESDISREAGAQIEAFITNQKIKAQGFQRAKL
jgi:hypothetical protein